jgi:hypothetical protein
MVWPVWVRYRLEWVNAAVAAALGAAYLLLPRMGSDLAAQVARAGFFADHGYTPIDLRWYAGVDQLGYSLVSQPVMALLGVRVTGAAALVASAALLAALIRRTGAARPWPGSLVGTACIAGNLVSGRVTYALGVALGLAALLALTFPRWRAAAVLPAFLAAATSPVAGLFTGLAGVALMLAGRLSAGLLIALPAAVPLVLNALFLGDGGWMNISRLDTVRAVGAGLVVAVLVPARPVRIGAVLSTLGVLTAALVHTAVGLNATRLAVMFALPVLAGYAALPRRFARLTDRPNATLTPAGPAPSGPAPSGPAPSGPAPSGPAPSGLAPSGPAHSGPAHSGRVLPGWAVILVLVAVAVFQPPVVITDVMDVGNPTAGRAYFAPLLARLRQETLNGRVEVPPTRDYWEAAYLDGIPLARGWLRQADIDRNPLFFTVVPGASGTGVPLTPDSYREWLADQAVQFVAVPDAVPTWSGRPEAEMITAGLPYLNQVWQNEHWRLYEVADPQPIVAPPAALVSQTAAALTLDTGATLNVVVKVHYYRWLKASGGAVVEPSGNWTLIRAPSPGRYTLTS